MLLNFINNNKNVISNMNKLKIDTKSVLLLQGAGDIKNIINILYKNETK